MSIFADTLPHQTTRKASAMLPTTPSDFLVSAALLTSMVVETSSTIGATACTATGVVGTVVALVVVTSAIVVQQGVGPPVEVCQQGTGGGTVVVVIVVVVKVVVVSWTREHGAGEVPQATFAARITEGQHSCLVVKFVLSHIVELQPVQVAPQQTSPASEGVPVVHTAAFCLIEALATGMPICTCCVTGMGTCPFKGTTIGTSTGALFSTSAVLASVFDGICARAGLGMAVELTASDCVRIWPRTGMDVGSASFALSISMLTSVRICALPWLSMIHD